MSSESPGPEDLVDHRRDPDAATVFLLDDHELVRRGLRELLQDAPGIEVVGEADRAIGTAARILSARPDVAILDVRLPDGSGIEVCRAVRAADPGIGCLMLTSYDDDEALVSAVLAGAAGFVLKQVTGRVLVAAVERVAAGESLLDPKLRARITDHVPVGGTEKIPTDLLGLTRQERRVLELIAEGLTNRQIAERMNLAEKTVKNYVSNVLTKLGLERRTQAVLLAGRLLDNR